MTERPALVIFDCDGVLVDSEPITRRVLAESLTRHGLPMSEEDCADLFVGGTLEGVYRSALGRGAALPGDWVAQIYAACFTVLAEEVGPVPGIGAALDRLDEAGLSYCVASNGPMRKMEITLGRCGMMERLAGRLFSAHEVGSAKPDPGLFLHAAAEMGAAPGACTVVGDSANDAIAARAAGMRCLGFSRETPAARLAEHGAATFDDMAGLPGLLGLTGGIAAQRT
jgi:HAD superfamily hydrolase (TIGR01509 family)